MRIALSISTRALYASTFYDVCKRRRYDRIEPSQSVNGSEGVPVGARGLLAIVLLMALSLRAKTLPLPYGGGPLPCPPPCSCAMR